MGNSRKDHGAQGRSATLVVFCLTVAAYSK